MTLRHRIITGLLFAAMLATAMAVRSSFTLYSF